MKAYSAELVLSSPTHTLTALLVTAPPGYLDDCIFYKLFINPFFLEIYKRTLKCPLSKAGIWEELYIAIQFTWKKQILKMILNYAIILVNLNLAPLRVQSGLECDLMHH